jgi:hypothetical protein
MSKKKKIDTNVSDKTEEDFLQKYIENQFTQKPTLTTNQAKTEIIMPIVTEPKKKQYFA